MNVHEENLLAAAQLVDMLDGQRRRDHEAFAEGYRLGFAVGHDVGYAHAQNEVDAEWSVMAAYIRSVANRPTFKELQQRRKGDHP